MKTIAWILAVLVLFTLPVYAQTLRERAVTSPLDCAEYLLSIDELGSHDISLINSLFRLGRYDDIIALQPTSYSFREFAHFGLELLKTGDKSSAEKFAVLANRRYKEDEDGWRASDFAEYNELLARLGRTDEAYGIAQRQEDLDDRNTMLLQIAEGAIQGRSLDSPKSAVQKIPADFFFSDARELIRLSDVFAAIHDKDSQLRLLNRVELDIAAASNSDPPDRLRLELIRRYLAIADLPHAKSLWESVGEKDEPYYQLAYIKSLLKFGQSTQGLKMLDQIDPKNFQNYGSDVVSFYIDQKLTDKASKYAAAISDKDDDYDQQSALMVLADHYLTSKNLKDAEKVLDLANLKASRIVYETSAEASTSPGIRKAKYLEAISQRYAKLGKFDKAINALRTLNVEDPRARENFASLIAKFTMDNAKSLGISRVTVLLKQATQIAEQQDDDSTNVEVAVSSADALCQLGQSGKAVEVITDLLEKYTDEYEETHALILSGEVFEKYKLPATDRLRRALSSIISNHEN